MINHPNLGPDWKYHSGGVRYAPRPERVVELWAIAYREQMQRCVMLAARKHCSPERRRKLEKRAAYIARWSGIMQ